MNYEIVTLQKKTLVGLTARTSNNDPQMGKVIGGLWKRLFGENIFATMKNKVNEHSIGLYSNYSSDASGEYDITVGCEVNDAADIPQAAVVKTIPAGRYAKFVMFGDMMEAVGNAWQEIWGMPLERTFTGDFEEYVSTEESGGSEIHIYIAIK
ncbi:GyrI-like domain-containing protein [Oscillospiraceae bacterium PP1C4]